MADPGERVAEGPDRGGGEGEGVGAEVQGEVGVEGSWEAGVECEGKPVGDGWEIDAEPGDGVGGSREIEVVVGEAAEGDYVDSFVPDRLDKRAGGLCPGGEGGGPDLGAGDGRGEANNVDGVGLRGRCVGRGHLHLDGVGAHAEVDLEAGGHGVGVRPRGV